MTKNVKYLSYIEDSIKHKSLLAQTAIDAIKLAIDAAKSNNLNITYLEGNKIIKESADGRIEVIGSIQNLPLKVKVGDSIEL
jgi:hypothetical protein